MSWFNKKPNLSEIKKRNARKRISPMSEHRLQKIKEAVRQVVVQHTAKDKPDDK